MTDQEKKIVLETTKCLLVAKESNSIFTLDNLFRHVPELRENYLNVRRYLVNNAFVEIKKASRGITVQLTLRGERHTLSNTIIP